MPNQFIPQNPSSKIYNPEIKSENYNNDMKSMKCIKTEGTMERFRKTANYKVEGIIQNTTKSESQFIKPFGFDSEGVSR